MPYPLNGKHIIIVFLALLCMNALVRVFYNTKRRRLYNFQSFKQSRKGNESEQSLLKFSKNQTFCNYNVKRV